MLIVAESTRKSMQANRSTNTTPEIQVRHALWSQGLRGYRKNVRKLPGKPDIVFTKARVAIFVHGCFWHQCPYCTRNRKPKANAEYWQSKFERNIERDVENSRILEQMGFRIVVVWECQVHRSLTDVIAMIKQCLDRQPQADKPSS